MISAAKQNIYPIMLSVQVILIVLIFTFSAGATEYSTDPLENIDDGKPTADHVQELVSHNEYQEGPHQKLTCTRCHKENKGGQQQSAESVNGDSILLCRNCHPVEHIHPIGLPPQQQVVEDEKLFLPLGNGILKGKIVCLTCHAIHQHVYTYHLLRRQNLAYSNVRNSLCFSCHVDHFSGKSPHTAEPSSCGFCHVNKPGKKESLTAPPDIIMQDSCTLCHSNLQSSHYEGVNPFIDIVIRQRADQAGNFFTEGRTVCTTCHDPHGKKNGRYLLRGDYVELCEDSRSLDPHWNDFLCFSCHLRNPVKGNAPLREEGDKNKVCNRCHHSEYAQPDIHPVEVKPSQHIRVPADMPLQNEKLSCETCHNSLLQMGRPQQPDLAETNPNFLRNNQLSRNSFCFLCHIEETYKRLNPHKQLNAQGEIQEETCLFCHASIPNVNFIGPERVSFIIHDPDEYCIGCHHGFTANHPAGFNHLIKPSDKIMHAIQTSIRRIGVELPLFEGKIVCATCHNPHDEGVIKIAAAATGTKRENKLRLMPGRNQCTGCHWDKE
ncbi:MAG: cytochrome c3 family protein [Desulfobulbaceae bacterium]|nr:cytochrome c3 family protein [Desulfobulbaceae bacterium]